MIQFTLTYQHQEEGEKQLTLQAGTIIFLVGSNGTGKSTLMHDFAQQNLGKTRRITAHRQVWFNSDAVDITPAGRLQTELNITNEERQERSRWQDIYAQQRSQATIFDLIDLENIDARKIADAARYGRIEEVVKLAANESPIATINSILKISNLHFQISIDNTSKVVATREGASPYSIAQLSDGERNALLIIANVLTASEKNLILLDEPERHLHKSIISPLISTLLSYRQDCAFVVSTHDVTLPPDQEKSSALLLRGYKHDPKSWLADYLPAVEKIDETIALAILGSRRKILFVEGGNSSLDIQLYQIIFPNVTIKTLGSCVDVERIVKGIRHSSETHWATAFGIIDKDNRSQEECDNLYKEGIIPLEQYSIESLYYHTQTIKAILNRVAQLNDIDPAIAYNEILVNFISSITPHKERMAARLVQRKAKDSLLKQAPDWKAILKGEEAIVFSPAGLLNEELNLIIFLLENKKIEDLISRYPLRETPALEAIAKGCLFPSQQRYEQAVRKMLIESKEELANLKTLILPLTEKIQD